MKTVTPKQMAFLESEAYRDGCSEDAFMKEAGKGVAEWVDFYADKYGLSRHIYLLCGKGNNGGDAYAAGIYLLEWGYSVLAYQIPSSSFCSTLSQKNQTRFVESGGVVVEVSQPEEEMRFEQEGIIIDGLFGTGFKGIVREPFATAIQIANASHLPILAIDIPSGLDGETGIVEGLAIRAKETLFLGLPKLGFFLQDGWNYVGKLHQIDFGLPQHYIQEFAADFEMVFAEELQHRLPQIQNNRHKYQAGYVVGLAGSAEMPGAALLSSLAALRSGAGIVKLLSSLSKEVVSSPELIQVAYTKNDPAHVVSLLNSAHANFIGPGLGRDPATRKLLKEIFSHLKKPCVIDADALTIIAEEKIAIPPHAILTPHIGEMLRLLKTSTDKPGTREFLMSCQAFADRHQVSVILKGGPSFLFHPGETIRINPYGDPGMATAGSGDVLTGILAALLAQGLTPREAILLGTYLHGYAGQEAAEEKTSYCMIASDIIESLPAAFWSLH